MDNAYRVITQSHRLYDDEGHTRPIYTLDGTLLLLAAALDQNRVADAIVAGSIAERRRLWALRDDVSALRRIGIIAIFDVSLPHDQIEAYVSEVRTRLSHAHPEARCVAFGHLGDGNVHLVVGSSKERSAEMIHSVEDIVYQIVGELGGSISAEHGIGVEKRAHLHRSRNAVEIATMRRLKQALDPNGIFNPGKLLPPM